MSFRRVPSDIIGRAIAPPCYPGHLRIGSGQKSLAFVYAGISAWLDPRRDDMVALSGETTGTFALRQMRKAMMSCPDGRRVLESKPVVSNASIRSARLEYMPVGSFGKAYADFMAINGFNTDGRRPVTLVDDEELAYILLRYRQVHDLWHTLFNLPPTITGEVALKWIEMVQTGLPSATLGALLGPASIKSAKVRKNMRTIYVPWALRAGRRAQNLMSVLYEEEWETNIDDLRKRLHIEVSPYKNKQNKVK
eukprot:16913_1